MKVTFVNPPYAYAPEEKVPDAPLDPENVDVSTFPVGLGILTAISEQRGDKVCVVEMPYLTEAQTLTRIVASEPDVVAFSCWTGNQRLLARLCKDLRKRCPRARIVWGGHHPTLFPEQVLTRYEVDYVIQGEGEIPFLELLDELDGGPAATAPGLLRRHQSGALVSTGPRVRLGRLDQLPFPAYHHFVLARNSGGEVEFGAKHFPGLSRRVTVLAARGCPYKCTFCVDGKMFSKTVSREVTRVVDEIEYLVETYNARLFEFNDMTFTLSQKRTAAMCQEIIRRGIDISWQAMSRVNVVSPELLEIMKRSGCYSVSYGVETGSPTLLKRIKKQIAPAEIIRAFRQTQGAGLSTMMLLMIGNPGETDQTISETIDLLYEAKPTQIDPSIYQVYPGSATYRDLKSQGYIDDDYWLSHDAAPYYTGEHSFSQLRYWQRKISFHHRMRPRERSFWSFFKRVTPPKYSGPLVWARQSRGDG